MAGYSQFSLKREQDDDDETVYIMDHVKESLTQIKNEYKIAAEKLQKDSEEIVSLDNVSGSTYHMLNETAANSQGLNIDDENTAGFLLQSTRKAMLQSRLRRNKSKFQVDKPVVDPYRRRVIDLRKTIQDMREYYEHFKEETERKAIETQFLQHKKDEYKNTLETMKTELQKLGVSENHQLIRERMESYNTMERECALVRLNLEKYEGLPPNLSQAEEVLAQTVQKLRSVEDQVNMKQKKLAMGILSGSQQHTTKKYF